MEKEEENGKHCRTCNLYKSSSEYYGYSRNPDGLYDNCKECHGKFNREYMRTRDARSNGGMSNQELAVYVSEKLKALNVTSRIGFRHEGTIPDLIVNDAEGKPEILVSIRRRNNPKQYSSKLEKMRSTGLEVWDIDGINGAHRFIIHMLDRERSERI